MEREPVSDKQLPSFRLDDRLAVVTGASQGIGRAFTLAYCRAGAEVVLVSRAVKNFLRCSARWRPQEVQPTFICADLSKIADIRR